MKIFLRSKKTQVFGFGYVFKKFNGYNMDSILGQFWKNEKWIVGPLGQAINRPFYKTFTIFQIKRKFAFWHTCANKNVKANKLSILFWQSKNISHATKKVHFVHCATLNFSFRK